MPAHMILIRGLPGSGKSTMAQKILAEMPEGTAKWVEADFFFEDFVTGEYNFDPSKIVDAHEWCQETAREGLEAGLLVVVSNTFTRLWEMENYFLMCRELGLPKPTVIEATGNYKSVHNVPEKVIENMRQRWEPYNA